MSLGSVSQIALSGISAAELIIGVVGNNLANARTTGFKASSPSFATQPSQTTSLGSGPAGRNGGTNPVQTGLGVQTAGILPTEGNPTIVAGATELSNTDVGQSLVDLSEASTLFRANLRVLDTSERMFDALLNLGRAR